jgi:hypothetical protein
MRVQMIHEVTDEAPAHQYSLSLQWCRWNYEDGSPEEMGYRFIWKRPMVNGKRALMPVRGQTRLPALADAQALQAKAVEAGWGSLPETH